MRTIAKAGAPIRTPAPQVGIYQGSGNSSATSSLDRVLAAIRATAARYGLDDLGLFTMLVFDHMADVVIAAVAAAGLLLVGAAARRVEGVAGWRYSVLVHSGHPFCGPASGVLLHPRGHLCVYTYSLDDLGHCVYTFRKVSAKVLETAIREVL